VFLSPFGCTVSCQEQHQKTRKADEVNVGAPTPGTGFESSFFFVSAFLLFDFSRVVLECMHIILNTLAGHHSKPASPMSHHHAYYL
jgi:hypothetical protein